MSDDNEHYWMIYSESGEISPEVWERMLSSTNPLPMGVLKDRTRQVRTIVQRIEAIEKELAAFGTAEDMEQWCKMVEHDMLAMRERVGELEGPVAKSGVLMEPGEVLRWLEIERAAMELVNAPASAVCVDRLREALNQ